MKEPREQQLAQPPAAAPHRRWLALAALCLGVIMSAMNATSVNVALPSIGLNLQLSERSLAWIVTAYFATFGGFLLLGGCLGDRFGRRLIYLVGIGCFTLASLVCGFATSLGALLAGRLLQGLGAAMLSAVAFSQVVSLFSDLPRRARALGIYFSMNAGGGGIGLVLGGWVTSAVGWQWVFFANIPIGVMGCAMAIALLPSDAPRRGRADVAGALAISSSSIITLYAILTASRAGWGWHTLSLLATAVGLLCIFVRLEARAHTPLVPLQLFKMRSFIIVNVAGVLLSAALFAWSFLSALYLQLVLGFSPLSVGLALLPASLITGAMSLLISPILMVRFGLHRPLVTGMLLTGVGLAFLGRAPISANMLVDVLPGMLLVGIGAGMAHNPIFTTAFRNLLPSTFGAASGITNTAFIMGGALGLSMVANIAAVRTSAELGAGATFVSALHSGYRAGLYVSASFVALAALMIGVFLRDEQRVHLVHKIGAEIGRRAE